MSVRVCCPNCGQPVLNAELADEANDGCCDKCGSGGRGSYLPGEGLGRFKGLVPHVQTTPPVPITVEEAPTKRHKPPFAHCTQPMPIEA